MKKYVVVTAQDIKLIETDKNPKKEKIYEAVFPYITKRKKLEDSEIEIIANELAIMIESGLPLLEAITVTTASVKKASTASFLYDLKQDVLSGDSLSESISRYHEVPKLLASVIASGEKSGKLPDALKSAEKFYKVTSRVKKEINGALVEPSITLTAAGLLFIFILKMFFPQLKKMMDALGNGMKPSGVLSIMFKLSDHIMIVSIIIAILVMLFFKYRQEFLLILPIASPAYKKVLKILDTFIVSNIFAITLSAGIPLTSAFQYAIESALSEKFKKALERANISVQEASSIYEAFASERDIPLDFKVVAHTGEKSGKLIEMFKNLADAQVEALDPEMEKMKKAINLAMLIVTAVVVLAAILPYYYSYFTMFAQLSSVMGK